jgi:hypothetical protein
MSRLGAFWRAYSQSFAWVGGMTEAWKKVGPFILFLMALAVSGLGTATKGREVNWLEWLQPWSSYLFRALLIVAIWKAGRAWQATEGPLIWMGKVEFDSAWNFFEFRLENRGPGDVIPRVYALDLQDWNGKRIPRIDPPGIEIHLRGVQKGDKVHLFGGRPAIAAMLLSRKGDAPESAHLVLTVPAEDPGRFGMVGLVSDNPTPLEDQVRLQLSIRVEFFDDKDNFITARTRKLTLIPDKNEPALYKIRPVYWLWNW